MGEQTFWMIYGDGQGKPTVKHHSLESAKAEASRLARGLPGVRFFILEAVGAVEKVDVRFMNFRDKYDDGIPF